MISLQKKMKVTVIIPTLNEAESIGHVLRKIPKDVVDDVLVVDGHSSDGTPELVKRLGYKVITQEGRGYGDAIRTGISHARSDVIITMDADGSYEAGDIPRLLEGIRDGYDVVYASRYLPASGSDDDTPVRYLGNKFFTFLLNKIHGVKLSDSLFLYVAAKTEIFKKVKIESLNFEYCIEFPIKVHKAGLKYTEIPSRENKRIAGASKVNAFYHGLRILWTLLTK